MSNEKTVDETIAAAAAQAAPQSGEPLKAPSGKELPPGSTQVLTVYLLPNGMPYVDTILPLERSVRVMAQALEHFRVLYIQEQAALAVKKIVLPAMQDAKKEEGRIYVPGRTG